MQKQNNHIRQGNRANKYIKKKNKTNVLGD